MNKLLLIIGCSFVSFGTAQVKPRLIRQLVIDYRVTSYINLDITIGR